MPILQIIFLFCFLDTCVQASGHKLSGLEVVGLPFTHLYAPNVPKGIDGPYHIVSRMVSCHRPFCRARCASNSSIPSHSPIILLVIHLLSLCGRLFLPLRSFLRDEECLCHDSIAPLLTSFNKLFLCSFYLASVTGEEIFVNMTLFRCFFCLHRLTLNPIREITLHD